MASPSTGVLGALRQLDLLLERAVAAMKPSAGGESLAPFRGLYITPDEAAKLLARAPGCPSLNVRRPEERCLVDSPLEFSSLRRLVDSFGLSPFDIDVLIVALAPEIDLRYERLYAYLQDDVTRRRPSVDLALNLLASTADERLFRRAHFSLEAPLIRHAFIQLIPDPSHVHPPLLGYYLKLDEQIVRWLTGEGGMDRRLESCCRFLEPGAEGAVLDQLPLERSTRNALRGLVQQVHSNDRPLRLLFHGRPGAGKLSAARALAKETGVSLLVADLNRWPEGTSDFGSTLRVAFREAWLKQAMLCFHNIDALRSDDRSAQRAQLAELMALHPGVLIVAGPEGWDSEGLRLSDFIRVPFQTPEFGVRRTHWQATLAGQGIALEREELDALAGRFRLTSGQIERAVSYARNRELWRSATADPGVETRAPGAGSVTLADLFGAARAQCSQELAKLARKIEPKQTWADIVLPQDQLAQLGEVCAQARYQHLVYGEWGFGRKLSLGKGLNALFAGPPGTGKTMAAEVIAGELQLDLYKIDLSQVVSKYIGETEKNLNRIFEAAESANAILFFDEADALFGKRSEVKDSHDRYANIEIGYLLQKMEEYEGVAILATNLRQNLDEAFVRRMHFVVDFPFPDEEHRRRIWEVTFPREAPLGSDVDFCILAREVKLVGGNIKNIALAAAFYAAADGRVINLSHLARAARREHQKLGRTWNEEELQKRRPPLT